MTPASRRRARRPIGWMRARWRGSCGRGSSRPCGCPMSAAACCGAGSRDVSNSCTRAENEIHAVLQRRLEGKPPCSDLFGVKGREWLAGLELPVEERESVDAGIRHIEFLDCEIAAVERLIARQALAWPEIRRLMTVPGVNLICAATFIAAVGDPRRFLTSCKLVAYLGLDPKVRQSGDAPARSGR